MTRASNNRWKDSTGSVITSKPSLDQARAIVTHKGGGLIVVTHVWSFKDAFYKRRNMKRGKT